MESLKNAHSIPLSVDQSFRARFLSGIGSFAVSAKSASSENVAIDESGSATHTVLDNPDIFVQIQIGSTIYYIPAFTS